MILGIIEDPAVPGFENRDGASVRLPSRLSSWRLRPTYPQTKLPHSWRWSTSCGHEACTPVLGLHFNLALGVFWDLLPRERGMYANVRQGV